MANAPQIPLETFRTALEDAAKRHAPFTLDTNSVGGKMMPGLAALFGQGPVQLEIISVQNSCTKAKLSGQEGCSVRIYSFADGDEPQHAILGLALVIEGLSQLPEPHSQTALPIGYASGDVPDDLAFEADDRPALFRLGAGMTRCSVNVPDQNNALYDAIAKDLKGLKYLTDLVFGNHVAFRDICLTDQSPARFGAMLTPGEDVKFVQGYNFAPELYLAADAPTDTAQLDNDSIQAVASGTLTLEGGSAFHGQINYPELDFELAASAPEKLSFSGLSDDITKAVGAGEIGTLPELGIAVKEARLFGNFAAMVIGASFRFEPSEKWDMQLGPITLSLDDLACSVLFDKDGLVSLDLAAQLHLGGFNLDLDAEYSTGSAGDPGGWRFSASATADDALPLAGALTALDPADARSGWADPLVGPLKVSTILLELDAIDGMFSLESTIEGTELGHLVDQHGLTIEETANCTLGIIAATDLSQCGFSLHGSAILRLGSFKLEDFFLQIDYTGGPNTALTGAISARVAVGDDLRFQARAEKTATGWDFAAHAQTQIQFTKAFEAIRSEYAPSAGTLDDAGVPDFLHDLVIDGAISLSAHSQTQELSLDLALALENGAGRVTLAITLSDTKTTVSGVLEIGAQRFALAFGKGKNGTALLGQYSGDAGASVTLSDLRQLAQVASGAPGTAIALGTNADAKATIALHNVLIGVAAMVNEDPRYLLSADISGGIDLTGFGSLPLIGQLMPEDQKVSLSLSALLANDVWQKSGEPTNNEAIALLEELRNGTGPALPQKISGSEVHAQLSLPGVGIPLALGLEMDAASGDDIQKNPADDAPADGLKWVAVNKSLGPVALRRIGIGLEKEGAHGPEIRLLIDAGLAIGGLDLELQGLGARYALNSKTLTFEMHGLGMDFAKGPIRIAGSFAEIGEDYLGAAVLSASALTISASGGFKMIGTTPSMFIYGVLNTPLGGPPFFFVEGLAAGFGYNRRLTAPALSEVHDFPFVTQAFDTAEGNADESDFAAQLGNLAAYVQPELGSYFGAVGIKFSSFKLLDSFVLLMLSTGASTRIDILGMTVFQNPAKPVRGVPLLARIEMDIKATIRPDEGSLLVQATIAKGSFILSPDVKLEGDFAFASWFSGPHAGDFVLTLGGYNPHFPQPAHYPTAKPVSLTFKPPGDHLVIKGEAYFALTPAMIMAGGGLSATGDFNGVHVSFALRLDMMVQWAPYHYDLRMSARIQASWQCFSTTATAALHIYGPDFAGRAHVDWLVISFDVAFGAKAPAKAPLLDWGEFKAAFLPAETEHELSQMLALTITKGQIGTAADGLPIVDIGALEILLDSPVPVLTAYLGSAPIESCPDAGSVIGCRPCGVEALQSAVLTINSENFECVPSAHSKSFPAALWGAYDSTTSAERLQKEKATVAAIGSVVLRPKFSDPNPPIGYTVDLQENAYDIKKLDSGPIRQRPDAGDASLLQPELCSLLWQMAGLPTAAYPPASGARK